jgi:hypothetical protein
MTWVKLRCNTCARGTWVIAQKCEQFGFPACRTYRCDGEMEVTPWTWRRAA